MKEIWKYFEKVNFIDPKTKGVMIVCERQMECIPATKYLDKSFKSDKEIILKILKKPLNYFSLGDELSPIDYMSKDFFKDEDVISEALQNEWIEYDKIDDKLIKLSC
jgi:hypothetical protein